MNSTRITSNIIWLLFERLIQIGFGVIMAGLLARSLGGQYYGYYQYAGAIIALFLSISFLCGAEIIVPLLSREKDHLRKDIILYNAFLIRVVASAFSYLALMSFVLLSGFDMDLNYLIIIWGISILFNEPVSVIKAWMESRTNLKPNVIIRAIAITVKLGFVIVFYKMDLSVRYVGLIMLFEAAIVSLGQLVYFRNFHKFSGNSLFIDRNLVKSLLIKGLPFWMGVITMYAFLKVDKLILERFVTFHELGLYTSATALSEQICALAPIITISVGPLLVYKEKNRTIALHNVIKITLLMALVSLAGSLVVYFLSDIIVKIVYGREFLTAGGILKYSVWISVFAFIDNSLSLYIYDRGNFNVYILKWVSGLILCCCTIFFLVHRVGVLSGVFGIMTGYVASIAVTLLFVVRNYRASEKEINSLHNSIKNE